MLLSYYSFVKLVIFSKINKLTLIGVNLINLNKIKLNYIILLIILLSIIYIKKNYYISIFIALNILFLNLKFIYFLNLFFYGLFKIHPILFYMSLLLYSHTLNNNLIYFKIRIITVIAMSTISLFLGGIWAMYQLNWGYYWSSDPIEFALLFIIGLYVYKLHTLKLQLKYKNILLIYILFYIYLIRSNLIYTKHNFFNVYNYLYVYIKIISYFLLINFLSFSVAKFITVKINTTYMCLLFLIIPLLFNLTFNILIKKFITNYTIFIVLYYLLLLSWEDLEATYLHITFFSFLLIFIMYKLQYIICFTYKNSYSTNINTPIFFKKNVKFESKYETYIKRVYQPSINKLEHLFNLKKIDFFLIKKKLVNYYV